MNPNYLSESFFRGPSGGIVQGRKRKMNREGEMNHRNYLSESAAADRSGGISRKRETKTKKPNGSLSGLRFRGSFRCGFAGRGTPRFPPSWIEPSNSYPEERTGNRHFIRPRLPMSSRNSFSREVSEVKEIEGGLHRRPKCLVDCYIDFLDFDDCLEGDKVTDFVKDLPNAPTEHIKHMECLASLALKAHNDYYYSGEEKYKLVSLERVVVRESIDEYYLTFTARQTGAPPSDDSVKTVQAIIVNYCGVFDFVLYVKINIHPTDTCNYSS